MNKLSNKMSWIKTKFEWARLLPFVVLTLLIIITLFIWQIVNQGTLVKGHLQFLNRTTDLKNRIRLRLHEQEKILLGGVGLFNSVGTVSRAQWRQYVSALQLDQNHPGIQGLGYSVWLKPKEKDNNISKIRKEGFPEYNINPSGNRLSYTSIIYLEPFNWRNQRAFGYDMYSEPIRRMAMDQAINTGLAAISYKIILIQETEEDKQNGILMYVPVYNISSPIDTVESRQNAIKGFVYSPIRMNDFILTTVGEVFNDIAIEITDTTAQQADKSLFNSLGLNRDSAPNKNKAQFEHTETVEVFNGREWLFKFKSLPNFDANVQNNDSNFVLVFGFSLSLILSFTTFILLDSRKKALALALEKTKALNSTERFYRTIYDNSPNGIIQLDSKLRFVSANSAFIKGLGYSENELKQKTILDVTFSDDLVKTKEIFSQFPKDIGLLDRFRQRLITKSGEILWVSMSTRSVTIDEGGEEYIFSSVEDITQIRNQDIALKEAEKIATESQERYRTFFEKNSSVILIIDPINGDILESNFAAQQYYGWSGDELKQLNIGHINVTPELDTVKELSATSSGIKNHHFFKHRDALNQIHEVEVFSTPIILHERTVNCSIIHDITQRKLMENQMRLAANVFANCYDGLLITDSECFILDVNPSFSRITGYEKPEVIGKTPHILASGKHDNLYYSQMWDSIEQHEFWSGKIWNRRKNGELYPEILSISVVKNKLNEIEYYVGIFSDISDLKRQEDKLIEARKTAEAATASKSRFLATMSHEIRTPMNGMLGMAQLLLMPELKDSDRIEYAQTIINSGNVLLTLLNDILDLSKVEAGKIVLEKIAFDPKQIIHDSLLLFSEVANKKAILFHGEWIGPASQLYIGDPHRLHQMISNLLSNAFKFTQSGKVKLEIREQSHDKLTSILEFSVTDTGIGIPPDKLNQLFKPFSQADIATSRKFGGTGLGLSIIANLAHLMNGNYGVSNNVDSPGSRFWFTITADLITPIQKLKIPKNPLFLTSKPLNSNTLTGRILVADDDPINRKVIEKFLIKLGYKVAVVENGQLALEFVIQGEPIDLILMDLQMPIMDGHTATQYIRKWEVNNHKPHLPIVAFTADGFEETHKHCLAMGMDDILTKPVSIGTLKNLMSKNLSNS